MTKMNYFDEHSIKTITDSELRNADFLIRKHLVEYLETLPYYIASQIGVKLEIFKVDYKEDS